MDGETIVSVMTRAANRTYGYLEDMQWTDDHPGLSEVEVVSSDVEDGFAVLHLESRIPDMTGLMLKVGNRILDEDSAGFHRYDEISRTIVVTPGEEVLRAMDEGEDACILSDLKFIIHGIADFYGRYGSLIDIPEHPRNDVKPIFPEDVKPTPEQAEAATGLLKGRMSYVWGAPGTGKTQFVLASAIRGCLEAGERLAIFAPTNNAAEQVLRGILKTFPENGVPQGIVRLGVPTVQFLKEHPEMCEDRQAQRRLDDCIRSLENLEEILYERRCEELRPTLGCLRMLGEAWDEEDLISRDPRAKDWLDSVRRFCSTRDSLEGLLDITGKGSIQSIDSICDILYGRQRPALAIRDYIEWSDADIIQRISLLDEEIQSLINRTTGNRIQNAPIIVGTPYQFISRFRPRGTEEDGRIELDVDRIFLDEACYCGLPSALALFSNGVPVVMLGDHMQLPPVSELDDEVI